MAKRWYIVQAYSNFERKVAEDIRTKVAQNKLGDLFEDVIVPTEKVVEMRRGRKVDAERQATRQHVIYRHVKQSGDLIDASVEDLNFSWITEKEMQVSAQKAGLTLAQTKTSFVEGVDGKEAIYILEQAA